jgi:ankyrin repeat protein
MKKINLFLLCILFTSNTYTNIFEDVRTKNKEAIKQRLENNENCGIKDEHGNNALHIAAQKGDTEIIDILTTAPTYENWSDWLYAWFYAPTLPYINEENNEGNSPLHCATHSGQLTTAEQLVQKGARIEAVNKQGLSPAFLAILKDDPRFIRVFVAHKLNLAQHKHNGNTIFHTAIQEKKPYSIAYCIKETSLHTVTDNNQKTPIFLAIDTEDDVLNAFTKEQLNDPASTGIKPIHYATCHNKYNVINHLLYNNITSVNEPDAQGNTPLFYADNEKTLNFLLERNADINKRNNKGEDILATATHNQNLSLIKTLTQQHNIDIDTRDNKGQTSLMRATIEQNHQTMKTLINLGANIRITDNKRENVLHKIARNGDQAAAKMVLDYEKMLLTDLNKNGDSPLFVAIQNGNIVCAEFLINAGSRIDIINNKGNTIIHELIENNNNGLFNRTVQQASYSFINHKNKNGESPLYLATKKDSAEHVKTLITHQAHIYDIDNKGNNIAHIAAEHGSLRTLQYLQSHQSLFTSINYHGQTPFVYGAHAGNLEATKLLLCDKHFKNGEVITTINAMKDNYYTWDKEYKVYLFLLQEHNNRLIECQKIVGIAQDTFNLIAENNNLCNILHQKQHNILYNPVELYSYYSENDLYKMSTSERHKIKAVYLECHNKELNARAILKQKLNVINLEDQKEQARVDALKDELIQAQHNINNTHSAKTVEQEISCCICFEEDPQLLKKIPCKNTHSDRICGACLQASSVKTCPICRGPITK